MISLINKSEKFYSRSLKAIKIGNYENGKKWLKIAKAYGYPLCKIYYQSGIIAFDQLNLKKALSYFQSYISLANNIDRVVFYYLGEIYYILGNTLESISYFKKTLEKGADILTQCKSLSYLSRLNYFKNNDLKKTIQNQFQYLLSLGNYTLEQKRVGAIIASLNDQHERSIELAIKVVEERPSLKETYKELAQCYMQAKQYNNVINLLRENKNLLKIDKTFSFMLSKAYYSLNRLNECKNKLLELSHYLPGNAKIYYNLANVFYKMNQKNRAGKYYLKAIQHDSKLYQAYFNLGILYHKNGLLEQGEKYYNQSKEMCLKPFSIYYNLGLLFFQKKDYFNSLDSFLKAFNLNSKDKRPQHNFNAIKKIKLIDPDLSRNHLFINKVNLYFFIIVTILIIIFLWI